MKEAESGKFSEGTCWRLVRTCALVAALGFSAFVQGETRVWTGGSGDWSATDNWLDGSIPVAGDTVYVSNTVSDITINIDSSDVSIAYIRFEGSGPVTLTGESLKLTGGFRFVDGPNGGNERNYAASKFTWLAYGADVNCYIPLVFDPSGSISCIATATNSMHFYKTVTIVGEKTLYLHNGLCYKQDSGDWYNSSTPVHFHAPVIGPSGCLDPYQSPTGDVYLYDYVDLKTLGLSGYERSAIVLLSSSNKFESAALSFGNVVFAGTYGAFPTNVVFSLGSTYANDDGAINLGNHDTTIDRLDGTTAGTELYAKKGTNGGRLSSTSFYDLTYEIYEGKKGVPRPTTLTMNATADGTTSFKVCDNISLVWNPKGDYTLTFTNRTSSTKGDILVKGGKVKLAGDAAFPNVTFVDVNDGADFEIASSSSTPISQSAFIRLGSGSKLVLSEGVSITVGMVSVDGTCVEAATYDSTEDWIEGDGTVTVGNSLSVWKSAAGGSWSDASNWSGAGVPDGTQSGVYICNASADDFTVTIGSAVAAFPTNFFLFNVGGGRTTLSCEADVFATASSIFVGEGGRIQVLEGATFLHNTIEPSAFSALSANQQNYNPLCRITIADGGEWLIAGGETVFTNFDGTLVVKGTDEASGRFDMQGGSLYHMSLGSAWPFTVCRGGVADLRDGTFTLPHVENSNHSNLDVAGGTLSFSNACIDTAGSTRGGSIVFGTGETVFDGTSEYFRLVSGNAFLMPRAYGETARITVKGNAVSPSQYYSAALYMGSCFGGRAVYDYEAVDNLRGGTFFVGDLAGEAELNVKKGLLRVHARGLHVAESDNLLSGARPCDPPSVTNAQGLVTVAAGTAMHVDGSLNSGWSADMWISGISVGFGNIPWDNGRFDGYMHVEGAVTNRSGNTMIGFGSATGTYVQNGGETYLCQLEAAGLTPILAVGAWSGVGRLVVSNGVFTSARGNVFLGGCPQSEVPVHRNVSPFDQIAWSPAGAPENHNDADGTITVVDGSFVAASNVLVGVDGVGTIEMVGRGGSFTAKDLVLSNATSSVVRFVSDAEGFSPVTVTDSLTVTDGASIEVDLSDYTCDLGSFRAFNVESIVGDLLDVDVFVTMNGEPLTKPYALRSTSMGVDLVIMTGTIILFK